MIDNKLVICWDVDDTILIPAVATGLQIDTPNYDTIAVYRWFQAQGCYMVIHSGGGISYAEMWATKLGLKPDAIWEKKKNDLTDIAFDDCQVDLARVNVRVKRFNNSTSRKDWNDHEKYGSENN